MGASLFWLATRGVPASRVLDLLQLKPTGKHLKLPEADFCAASLPSGWHIILGEFEDPKFNDRMLAKVSAECELIAAGIEEHVMVSTACAWSSGRLIWRITHDSQEAPHHLDVTGTPPPQFPPIRAKIVAEQASEDDDVDSIINIPLALAESLAGFHHENDLSTPWEVLQAM